MKKFVISSILIGALVIPQSIRVINADTISSSLSSTSNSFSLSGSSNSIKNNYDNHVSFDTTGNWIIIPGNDNGLASLKNCTARYNSVTIYPYVGGTVTFNATLPDYIYTQTDLSGHKLVVSQKDSSGKMHNVVIGEMEAPKHSQTVKIKITNTSWLQSNNKSSEITFALNIGPVCYVNSDNSSVSLSSLKSNLSSGVLNTNTQSSSLVNKSSSNKISSNSVVNLSQKSSSKINHSSSKTNLNGLSFNSKSNSSENNSLNLKSSVKKSNNSSELKDSANLKFNGNIPDNDDNQQASKGYSSKNSLGKSLTESSSSELKSVSKRVNQIENSSVGGNIKHQNDLNAQGQTESKQQNNLKTGPNSDNQKLPQTGDRPFNIIEFLIDLFK